jgi:hypothetical protein
LRYRDLTEAPIDQYLAVGDWDDPKGSFRSSNRSDLEKSHKIIHSPAAVRKIRDAWIKVPQKFNFWMLNDTGNRRLAVQVYDIDEFRSDKRFESYIHQITPAADAINVIYTTNFTTPSNYKPMTAWIMAHRLVHVFQLKSGAVEFNTYRDVERKLVGLIIDTISAYGIEIGRSKDALGLSFSNNNAAMSYLISRLFTMRSARMQKLSNALDFPAELLAQHLLSGGVRFNPVPLSIPKSNGTAEITQRVASELDSRWQDFSEEVGQMFDEILDNLGGKVIVL